MRRLLITCLVFALFCTVLLVPAGVAYADFNPLANVKCSDPEVINSAVCDSPGGDPLTGPEGIIIKATRIIAIIAGFAAVIVIILAGIRYITSSGSPDQVSQAKKTLIYAAVGLIVIVLGQAIISFSLSRI